MEEKLRSSGVVTVGDISWGTHLCQFYKTKEELVELIVAYVKAGLKNNELCVWVVSSQPADLEKSKGALRKSISEIDIYLEKEKIEIISYSDWYFKNGVFNPERVLAGWVEKLNQALKNGYDGLRLVGDAAWLGKEHWNTFIDYEEKLDQLVSSSKMMALCTYCLDNLNVTEITDVLFKHQFALMKREGEWARIENSRPGKAQYNIQVLANIVESSDDAIITKSLDGIITSWNKGAERIYGYSAKEILGKPISILEPPILFEETKELTELVKQEERIHHYETLRLRKDNQIINVSLTLSPIFDASGRPTAALVIARDVTESKEAVERVRRSQEMYKIITEQTGQLIYDYNLRTNRCSWEGAIEEVTGYSSVEFRTLGEYFWNTNIESLDANFIGSNPQNIKFEQMQKTGNKFKEELRLRRKDGTYIYIENKGIYLKDPDGYTYKIIGIIKDITDLKFKIRQIEESEEKYRSFIQNFQGIVYHRDENFATIFMHGAVEEITGYSEKEFIKRIKWKDIIYPDDLPLVYYEEEKVHKFLSTGYESIEYRIIRRDKRIRWIHEIYQKIKRTDGKPAFYQGTIYDVTERREAESFLKNMEVARKKEVHHRIKNNLQVISSLLDLQAEKFQEKECINGLEVLEAFKESQNRVASMSLIHEELYKGGGNDTLEFSAYIRKLTENLFQTYRLSSKNLLLNMDLEKNAYFNMDHAIPLGIIVNELVSNALKYAFPEDGEGEIKIKLCREKENNKTHESLFSLTISDNGKGIPEDLKLENLESLGLRLVTLLVEQVDGKIELKRSKGTEFRITFEVTENLC